MTLQEIPPLPESMQLVMIFQEVIMPALGIGTMAFLGWLGFRTWDRHLERKRGGAAVGELEEVREEVRHLREQAGAMHDVELRLGELEERLDFAERMLTQRNKGELPGQAGGEGAVEDILAIVFIFGGGSAFLLAISPIGRAIADRIRGSGAPVEGGADVERIREAQMAVLDEVYQLRQEVTDLQERLDFAERMLLRREERPGVGPGEVNGP